MNEVILIGYFAETAELCKKCGCTVVGVVDKEAKGPYLYLGDDDAFISRSSDYSGTALVITPDKPELREKIYEKYKKTGFHFKTLIAPEAVVAESAVISEGCMIQSLCNVSSNVFLDRCVRINTGANVMHDGKIGAFSVVAPNAVLLGYSTVGKKSYVGANSTVLPGITVGSNAIVGAGAVVTKDVKECSVVAGVPARILKKEDI